MALLPHGVITKRATITGNPAYSIPEYSFIAASQLGTERRACGRYRWCPLATRSPSFGRGGWLLSMLCGLATTESTRRRHNGRRDVPNCRRPAEYGSDRAWLAYPCALGRGRTREVNWQDHEHRERCCTRPTGRLRCRVSRSTVRNWKFGREGRGSRRVYPRRHG